MRMKYTTGHTSCQTELFDKVRMTCAYRSMEERKHAHLLHKTERQKVIRTNITLPPRLLEAAHAIVKQRGFVGLSDYIQARIRSDAGLDLSGIQ